MQVIGLCRFSYPAIGGFQVEHDRIEDRIAYLYAESRLEERFRLFECVTLPALQRQSDPDFTLILLIGDSLPQHHVDRLRALTSDMAQVRLVTRRPERHRPLMKQLLNETRTCPDEPCLQFRMDDDDAVAIDFVERLRNAAELAAPLCAQNQTVAIDFCNGFLGRFGHYGIGIKQVTRPYLTAALGMYVAGGVRTSIMNFAHHRIFQKMPTLTFNTNAMFLRSYNGFNDARQSAKAKPEDLPIADQDHLALLQSRFAISEPKVRQVFATQQH